MMKQDFKRNNRRWMALLLAALLLCGLILSGCSAKSDTPDGGMVLYYLNADQTGVETRSYNQKAKNVDAQIEEMLDAIRAQKDTSEAGDDVSPVLPEGVAIERYDFMDSQLFLYLNHAYLSIDPVKEVLIRGAIVKSLLQIEGVDGVSFYVDNLPLKDKSGNPVGIMRASAFSDNMDDLSDTAYQTELALYFSDEAGTGLVRENHVVYAPNNVSSARLVVEELIAGPKGEGLKATIDPSTGLNQIAVIDGVCYVNLDNGFMEQQYDIQENVVIYSIVNSLSELPDINSVQISVNGNTDLTYRTDYSLKHAYEKNTDIVDTVLN